jgi:hypothetical protein
MEGQMKLMIKREHIASVLRATKMPEDLIRAVCTDLENVSESSVPRDKKWKEQFPNTLYVMEPLTKREDLTHETQEFPGYSETDGGEADDVYAVYELMGFVKVVERKTKETIDV